MLELFVLLAVVCAFFGTGCDKVIDRFEFRQGFFASFVALIAGLFSFVFWFSGVICGCVVLLLVIGK